MTDSEQFNTVFSSGFRTLLDAQNFGVWILNARGDVLYINPSGMKAIGVERLEDVLMKNTVTMSELGYSTSRNMEQVLKTHKPICQKDVLTRTGELAEIATYPILDENGDIAFIIAFNIYKGAMQFAQDALLAQQIASHLLQSSYHSDGFIVESEEMKAVMKIVSRVADRDATVLLIGESGVGKDGIAGIIHKLSPRSSGPYVPINCSAIPENLLESELFGYEKGAFTGATTSRMGLLEMANKGTVFLDEIGDLSPTVQVKLLRTLQNRSIMRLGSKKAINLDVRFITATNQHLEKLVEEGRFREDFYYRINVIKIEIPPLRRRKADIMPLCRHFAEKFEKKYKEKKYFSRMTERMLMEYPWPGNIRELENTVEQALTFCPYSIVSPNYLPSKIRQNYKAPRQTEFPTLREAVQECEKALLREVIRSCGSSRKAARVLGVDQKTVLRKMKQHGLSWPSDNQE